MRRRLAAVVVLVAAIGAVPFQARAETPRKPITCVYPYVPSSMHVCVYRPDRLPIPTVPVP